MTGVSNNIPHISGEKEMGEGGGEDENGSKIRTWKRDGGIIIESDGKRERNKSVIFQKRTDLFSTFLEKKKTFRRMKNLNNQATHN